MSDKARKIRNGHIFSPRRDRFKKEKRIEVSNSNAEVLMKRKDRSSICTGYSQDMIITSNKARDKRKMRTSWYPDTHEIMQGGNSRTNARSLQHNNEVWSSIGGRKENDCKYKTVANSELKNRGKTGCSGVKTPTKESRKKEICSLKRYGW